MAPARAKETSKPTTWKFPPPPGRTRTRQQLAPPAPPPTQTLVGHTHADEPRLAALGVVASLTGVLMDVVPFTIWVGQVLRPSESGMRLAASPLVSGWRFVGLTHPDLFWLGLARAGNGWSLVALAACL